MLIDFIYQHAYFFSLIFGILPLTLFIDSRIGFAVSRRLITKEGLIYLLLTAVFFSLFDLLWIRELGGFSSDRIVVNVFGVPIEEMLFFVLAFYNVLTVFVWARPRVLK